MFEISGIGAVTAFGAGVISFLSPCVLPLIPGYVSYVAGRSLDEITQARSAAARLRIVALSAFFVLGFSTVFMTLGASATKIGQLVLSYRYEANILGGVIVALFGLLITGLVRIPWLERELRFNFQSVGSGPVAAYVLGLAFGFGWTPCIGPVLGAVLTMSATTTSLGSGIALLGIYSLGLGIPFLIVAGFAGLLVGRLHVLGRWGRLFRLVAGIVLILMGIAMMAGYLTAFANWLLLTFPVLGRIG